MVYVVTEPIRPEEMYEKLTKNTAGSVLLHYAVVKETPYNEAGTKGVEYCRNGDMEGEMAGIIEISATNWRRHFLHLLIDNSDSECSSTA